jgi:hypothetical protein
MAKRLPPPRPTDGFVFPEADPFPVSSRAFWLGDDPSLGQWVDAIEEVDRRGDKSALLARLRSEAAMPRAACRFLVDLLQRYNFRHVSPRDLIAIISAADEGARDAILASEADPAAEAIECIALLGSDNYPIQNARERVAVLLEHHVLKKKKGRQQTPLYDLSSSEALLLMAADDVADLRDRGTPLDEALRKVRESYGRWPVDDDETEDALRNACSGRRGSMRKMKKRISAAFK